MDVSLDGFHSGGNHGQRQWLMYIWGKRHKHIRSGDAETAGGNLNVVSGLRHTTNVGQQVLWESKWGVSASPSLGFDFNFPA